MSDARGRKNEPKDDSNTRSNSFRTVVSHVNPSVVAVLVDGRQVSLGTIITPDGVILTKASELGDHIRCRLRDGREFDAVSVGEHDLVLRSGEAAEFDTRVPHWFDRSGDEPVELLMLFGPQGERMHVRARPKA